MSETTTRWYRIRIPNSPDAVVRDDTGEPPEQWGSGGLRRFPVVVGLVPIERSKHNHVPSGEVRLEALGPSWVNLGVLGDGAIPVSEVEPDCGLVRSIEGMLSRVVRPSDAEVAEVAGPPRLVTG